MAAFSPATTRKGFITMPKLGHGTGHRSGQTIKLWALSIRAGIHLIKCATPETVMAQFILMWAHDTETSDTPKYEDIFETSPTMDELHNPVMDMMKSSAMTKYQIISRRIVKLSIPTRSAYGENREFIEIRREFKGRFAKYVQFDENAIGGDYSSINKGGLFYFFNFFCSDLSAEMQGEINSRIIYFH